MQLNSDASIAKYGRSVGQKTAKDSERWSYYKSVWVRFFELLRSICKISINNSSSAVADCNFFVFFKNC